MSTIQATLPNYDDITEADNSGRVACKPEVFPIDGYDEELRLVLVAKVITTHADGSPWVFPSVVLEECKGHDSLGVGQWKKKDLDGTSERVIRGLVLTIRRMTTAQAKPVAPFKLPAELAKFSDPRVPDNIVGLIYVPPAAPDQPLPPGTVVCRGPDLPARTFVDVADRMAEGPVNS